MMIKKTLFCMVLLFIFSSLLVMANEIEIPYGSNATISLDSFSRTYVRVYEGSKINFNVIQEETNSILIRNSIVIQEITQNGTKALISLDRGDPQEIFIFPGETIQYNYTRVKNLIPFFELKQTITHYEEAPENRNIVLYFSYPFPLTKDRLDRGPTDGGIASSSIDTNIVNPGGSEKEERDLVKIGIWVVVAILIIYFFYLLIRKNK